MRLASLATTCAVACAVTLLCAPASAETGDALVVTGDGVNVRSGPSPDASIRMRVHHDQQVIELEREGSWVRAEIAGTDGQEGWIHNSLLARPGEEAGRPAGTDAGAADAPEEPATAAAEAPSGGPAPSAGEQMVPLQVEPAAGPQNALGELARFRETVSYLNERATALAGGELFAEVKPGADGAMQVVATDAWSSLAPGGRQSFANTLLDRWAATKVSEGPAVLQIVDPSGEVVMEKTQP